MYAPKFRSWMTDWERFEEMQERRINERAEEAIREIHQMADAARKYFEPPTSKIHQDSYYAQLALLQQYASSLPNHHAAQIQNPYLSGLAAGPNCGLFDYIGIREFP